LDAKGTQRSRSTERKKKIHAAKKKMHGAKKKIHAATKRRTSRFQAPANWHVGEV
jgi:hypothetical protein